MNEYDQYFGTEAESIYTDDFKESEKYKEFLQYLCDKDVVLSIVKCRLAMLPSPFGLEEKRRTACESYRSSHRLFWSIQ